jgi:enamine deaminase RidA (YjgF/YER057c/UK114 family)
MGNKLRSFVVMLKVLPVSSADCERGFSQMNLNHTSGRSRQLVSTVNYDDLPATACVECSKVRYFVVEVWQA